MLEDRFLKRNGLRENKVKALVREKILKVGKCLRDEADVEINVGEGPWTLARGGQV